MPCILYAPYTYFIREKQNQNGTNALYDIPKLITAYERAMNGQWTKMYIVHCVRLLCRVHVIKKKADTHTDTQTPNSVSLSLTQHIVLFGYHGVYMVTNIYIIPYKQARFFFFVFGVYKTLTHTRMKTPVSFHIVLWFLNLHCAVYSMIQKLKTVFGVYLFEDERHRIQIQIQLCVCVLCLYVCQ